MFSFWVHFFPYCIIQTIYLLLFLKCYTLTILTFDTPIGTILFCLMFLT